MKTSQQISNSNKGPIYKDHKDYTSEQFFLSHPLIFLSCDKAISKRI